MKQYIIHDADGYIISTGTCQEEVFHLMADEGQFVIEGYCADENKRIVDGEIVDVEVVEQEVSTKEQLLLTQKQLREWRNLELKNTDWTQMPDCPLTDTKKQEWADYRQQLRDLPEQNNHQTNIEEIDFPDEPR